MKRLVLFAAALAFGGATVATANWGVVLRDRPYDLEYIPRSSSVRWLSLGHPVLAANFYWLRAVQYIGEPMADRRGWNKLFPIVDLITDLDPRHGYAYQVAGNVLAGVGRIQESNQILEKGMRNLPGRYILPFHRAVNALLYQGDYALAGRLFERAAATPGAPEHLREYVLAMYVKANQADAAIGFLSRLLEEAADPESRKAIQKQLEQARLERTALVIDEAIERYRERFLLRPFTLEQLVDKGLLSEIPADPLGGNWIVDQEGRVHSSVNPRRFQKPLSAEQRGIEARALNNRMRGTTP